MYELKSLIFILNFCPFHEHFLRQPFADVLQRRCSEKFRNTLNWRRTLGLDDLIIFKCFRVDFSLKKKAIQFLLSFNLYFKKEGSKVVNLPLTNETLYLSFWHDKQDKWLFQFKSYHEVVMYLFNSLAKSYFETTLKQK